MQGGSWGGMRSLILRTKAKGGLVVAMHDNDGVDHGG